MTGSVGQTTQEPLLKVKLLHPDAKLPERFSKEAAGFDIYAYCKQGDGRPSKVMIPSHSIRSVPTGVAIQLSAPQTLCAVCSRSGMAKERGIFVANSPGIVDPDYTGEIQILLYNSSHETYWVVHEQRIAQLVPLVYNPLRAVKVDSLQQTERGERGFGSTGR